MRPSQSRDAFWVLTSHDTPSPPITPAVTVTLTADMSIIPRTPVEILYITPVHRHLAARVQRNLGLYYSKMGCCRVAY